MVQIDKAISKLTFIQIVEKEGRTQLGVVLMWIRFPGVTEYPDCISMPLHGSEMERSIEF